MRRHWTAALLLVVVVLLVLPRSAAASERSVADDLPRSYAGSFKWDGSSEIQSVVMSFRTVKTVSGDTVEAEGCGVYNSGERITTIRVRMSVRVPCLAVTIWELDPIDEDGFVVNGSHEGHLADDLQTIDAIWTTRETGERGRLRLHAAPGAECEPLHESQAPATAEQRRPSL